jgi:toxin ParE1/3/4
LRVEISPAAADDILSIHAYLAQFSPMAADGAVGKLRVAIFGLSHFPHRGRPRADGMRELLSVRPYVIVYDVEGNVVTVLRIWHGAQNRL